MPPKPRMPSRQEPPKEKVVYAASKIKGPAFKPQRPSQVPRVLYTEFESSNIETSKRPVKSQERSVVPDDDDSDAAITGPPAKKPKPTTKPGAPSKQRIAIESDDDDESDAEAFDFLGQAAVEKVVDSDDSDEELPADPLAGSRPKQPKKPAVKLPRPRKVVHAASPRAVASSPACSARSPSPVASPLTQSEDLTTIPQPLLVRLLHEHLGDKKTTIDKHAIVVLQKYFEVFVREAIARTALSKREKAQRGECSNLDAGWLEAEDLEQVAAGMVLDF